MGTMRSRRSIKKEKTKTRRTRTMVLSLLSPSTDPNTKGILMGTFQV
jgi:hypothetical protein